MAKVAAHWEGRDQVIEAANITSPATYIAPVSAPAAVTSSAPSAVTSSQNATTNAATQTGGYVQADVQTITALANALKVSYNAAQVDIAALRATLLATQADVVALRATAAATVTALNAATAALIAAGLMNPS